MLRSRFPVGKRRRSVHIRRRRAPRGCSSMVERQLPKLHTRVRFPSPAPPVATKAVAWPFRSGRLTPRDAAGTQVSRTPSRLVGAAAGHHVRRRMIPSKLLGRRYSRWEIGAKRGTLDASPNRVESHRTVEVANPTFLSAGREIRGHLSLNLSSRTRRGQHLDAKLRRSLVQRIARWDHFPPRRKPNHVRAFYARRRGNGVLGQSGSVR